MIDSLVPRPVIQTHLAVGTSDIVSMMVQNHIDQLDTELDHLEVLWKAQLDQLLAIVETRRQMFQAKLESQRSSIDMILHGMSLLTGKEYRVKLNLYDPEDTFRLFYEFGLSYDNQYARFSPYTKKVWESSWGIEPILNDVENDDRNEVEDEVRGMFQLSSSHSYHELHALTVSVPQDLTDRINTIGAALQKISARRYDIKKEIGNRVEVERKLSAAFTRTLLGANPEFLTQIDAVLQQQQIPQLEVQEGASRK